jgi:hypothetical protein
MHAHIPERRQPRAYSSLKLALSMFWIRLAFSDACSFHASQRPPSYVDDPYAAPDYRREPYYDRRTADRRYNEPSSESYRDDGWRDDRAYYEHAVSPERYDGYRGVEDEEWPRHVPWDSAQSSEHRSAPAWDRSRRASTSTMFEPSDTWKHTHRERRLSGDLYVLLHMCTHQY